MEVKNIQLKHDYKNVHIAVYTLMNHIMANHMMMATIYMTMATYDNGLNMKSATRQVMRTGLRYHHIFQNQPNNNQIIILSRGQIINMLVNVDMSCVHATTIMLG